LTDVDFAELSKSFANPQFAATVIHYYRHRSGMAPGAPHYAKQQELLDTMPAIEVPTIFVFGDADGANLASSSRGSDGHFQGPFEPRELAGVGHFIQRERPDAVAALIASATAHCGE
jgi:pimeloyl-ACP methyl ester carboxylesterase